MGIKNKKNKKINKLVSYPRCVRQTRICRTRRKVVTRKGEKEEKEEEEEEEEERWGNTED